MKTCNWNGDGVCAYRDYFGNCTLPCPFPQEIKTDKQDIHLPASVELVEEMKQFINYLYEIRHEPDKLLCVVERKKRRVDFLDSLIKRGENNAVY